MRTIFLIATFFCSSFTYCPAQSRFISQDYSDFYDWFHQRSQVEQLYTDGSTLYIFADKTGIYEGPCRQSLVLGQLSLGQMVTNIAYDEYYVPQDEINGYGDIWYQVSGKNSEGETFQGYVWGAQIAKGWRQTDMTGDSQPELVMLGISSRPREKFTDINAEIRIVQNGKLLYQKTVPGLCVFEDCDSSPMLRVLKDPNLPGLTILEASTMTISCFAGIEKAFFHWNGNNLRRVFHAEYTTDHQYAKTEFTFTQQLAGQTLTKLCHYSHEDENYNPVWDCKTIKAPTPAKNGKSAVAIVQIY